MLASPFTAVSVIINPFTARFPWDNVYPFTAVSVVINPFTALFRWDNVYLSQQNQWKSFTSLQCADNSGGALASFVLITVENGTKPHLYC